MRQQVIIKKAPEVEHGEEMAELAERDAEAQDHTAELLDDTDRLLEEIEEALGENLSYAAEFVAEYQQKGGE